MIGETAKSVVDGLSRSPALLAVLAFNAIVIGGWTWLLVRVGERRAAEYHQLVELLQHCMKQTSP